MSYTIPEILVWIVGTVVAISWLIGVRVYIRSGDGISRGTVVTAMLFALAVTLVPVVGCSPFHLLWLFAVAWLMGPLSLAFPFSLLAYPAALICWICSLGTGRTIDSNPGFSIALVDALQAFSHRRELLSDDSTPPPRPKVGLRHETRDLLLALAEEEGRRASLIVHDAVCLYIDTKYADPETPGPQSELPAEKQ